jgi:hypothetical protein
MKKIHSILKARDFSISALAKWILSVCSKIRTIQVKFLKQPNDFHDDIGRLKKLKKLEILVDEASELTEVTLNLFRITTTLLTSS